MLPTVVVDTSVSPPDLAAPTADRRGFPMSTFRTCARPFCGRPGTLPARVRPCGHSCRGDGSTTAANLSVTRPGAVRLSAPMRHPPAAGQRPAAPSERGPAGHRRAPRASLRSAPRVPRRRTSPAYSCASPRRGPPPPGWSPSPRPTAGTTAPPGRPARLPGARGRWDHPHHGQGGQRSSRSRPECWRRATPSSGSAPSRAARRRSWWPWSHAVLPSGDAGPREPLEGQPRRPRRPTPTPTPRRPRRRPPPPTPTTPTPTRPRSWTASRRLRSSWAAVAGQPLLGPRLHQPRHPGFAVLELDRDHQGPHRELGDAEHRRVHRADLPCRPDDRHAAGQLRVSGAASGGSSAPLTGNERVAPGSDSQVVVIDRERRRSYELWDVAKDADGTVKINGDGSVTAGSMSVVDLDGRGNKTAEGKNLNITGRGRLAASSASSVRTRCARQR